MINHEKRMLKYPTKFTPEQQSLVYGSLLGDACVHKPKNRQYARFQIKHSISQTAYVNHKFAVMRPWINSNMPSISNDKSGYVGKPRIVFATTSHPLFNNVLSEFYIDNIKKVTPSILAKVDELALAYWFCDDGSYHLHPGSRSSAAKLSTESFTIEENEMIRNWFQDRWNIKCSLQRKIDNVFRLHFSANPARQLVNLIAPHVIPEMKFKVKLLAHSETQSSFGNIKIAQTEQAVCYADLLLE